MTLGTVRPARVGRPDRDRPSCASVIRLVGMILAEQDDEWPDGRRYFRPETLALTDAEPEREEVVPALLMAS